MRGPSWKEVASVAFGLLTIIAAVITFAFMTFSTRADVGLLRDSDSAWRTELLRQIGEINRKVDELIKR